MFLTNHGITFRLLRWCMLGMFFLLALQFILSVYDKSGPFESVQRSAKMYSLDLGLYTRQKELWRVESTPTEKKIPSTKQLQGESNPQQCWIMQASKPIALPTELFAPPPHISWGTLSLTLPSSDWEIVTGPDLVTVRQTSKGHLTLLQKYFLLSGFPYCFLSQLLLLPFYSPPPPLPLCFWLFLVVWRKFISVCVQQILFLLINRDCL